MDDATRAGLGARITVVKGFAAGQSFEVDRFPAILGRGSDCEVCLEDDPADVTLSRRHARLTLLAGRLRIEDLSTNGTSVGKRLLDAGRICALADSEDVWLGPKTQLRVETVRTSPVAFSPGGSLRVKSFGGFAAFWRDEEVPFKAWETRKPIVVFTYLAWHGERPVSPERLCADLWPDHGRGGRQALQSTLARVRRALRVTGIDPVLFERGAYRLNPALGLEFDAEQMTTALRGEPSADDLYKVRGLYGGPFLEGFNEDWVCLRRDELEQQFQQAMGRLGGLLLESGEHSAAVSVYREVLRQEPCSELGHMGMLKALVAMQQRDGAVRHYHRYVDTLKTQLGLSPSPEMLRLYYTLCR